MKYIFPLFVLVLFSNCEETEPVELINTWKLTETLFDPGDGSGTFQPVASEATITFLEDGTFETDAFSCGSYDEADIISGTFSTEENTLTFDECQFSYTFEQFGNILIINLVCIEPCRLKFRLIG